MQLSDFDKGCLAALHYNNVSYKENVMNKVYNMGECEPLTPKELANAANTICCKPIFSPFDFSEDNPKSRISGSGHCYCGGNGEFELLPLYDAAVKEGHKRYMVCRKCGGTSHL